MIMIYLVIRYIDRKCLMFILFAACYDNEDDKDGGTFRGVDFVNAVRSVTLSQMETALKTLEHDLAKSSTGKACLGMVFFSVFL